MTSTELAKIIHYGVSKGLTAPDSIARDIDTFARETADPLFSAACNVIARWEGGDLAEAVRDLRAELEAFTEVPAPEKPAIESPGTQLFRLRAAVSLLLAEAEPDGGAGGSVVSAQTLATLAAILNGGQAAPEPDTQTKALTTLAKAARAWWRGHRPLAWSAQQHLKTPAVNAGHTETSERLAKAVAAAITAGVIEL